MLVSGTCDAIACSSLAILLLLSIFTLGKFTQRMHHSGFWAGLDPNFYGSMDPLS